MHRVKNFYNELAQGKLVLAFQPVVWLPDSRRVLYQEGLLRHIDAQGEGVHPFAMLEKHQLLRELDRSVVSCVIERLLQNEHLRLGCNISAQSAIVDHYWQPILMQLRDTPSVAARLVIEVTESATPPSTSAAIEFVLCLREMGCRVAIDDFGAGYSGLNLLAELQPDQIKMDMALIRGIESNGPRQAIVRAIASVCIDLGIDLMAEGVETLDEFQWLRGEGIQLFQGYLFAKPSFTSLPPAQFPD